MLPLGGRCESLRGQCLQWQSDQVTRLPLLYKVVFKRVFDENLGALGRLDQFCLGRLSHDDTHRFLLIHC